jgi:hypothetical protein
MNDLEKMCREHFNEPVLTGLQIGRLVGYGEDEHDCYLIIRYPHPNHTIWHTCVGGYIFLNTLREQGVVQAHNGERWDDLLRLDGDLQRSGIPKAEEFMCVRRGKLKLALHRARFFMRVKTRKLLKLLPAISR